MSFNARGAALGREMGLAGFWDDVYKVASGVAAGAQAVTQVRSGNATGGVVFSQGGVTPFLTPTPQGLGMDTNKMLLLGGAAVLAFILLKRRR